MLWEPPEELLPGSKMARYMRERGFDSTTTSCGAGRWTTSRASGARSGSCTRSGRRPSACSREPQMPGAVWFPARSSTTPSTLFRGARGRRAALVHATESRPLAELSWDELATGGALRGRPAPARRGARRPGGRLHAERGRDGHRVPGDASIGAIWSSCAPEFGTPTVVDRFAQIEPKVLIATEGYRYGGRDFDRRERVREIERGLPDARAHRDGAVRLGRAAGRARRR